MQRLGDMIAMRKALGIVKAGPRQCLTRLYTVKACLRMTGLSMLTESSYLQ